MVKIAESKGQFGEGFTRIFGDERIGVLFSKVQASIIRSGFELEEAIYKAIPNDILTTLAALEENTEDTNRKKPPIQVVYKPSRPNPENPKKSIQADFLIVNNTMRRFELIEVKEGHVFDTKKADGELVSLKSITAWLAQEFAFRTTYFLCSFNQSSKEAIVNGSKKRFTADHVMTGRELCDRIGIDYDTLREGRKRDQHENLQYFLSQLAMIPEAR